MKATLECGHKTRPLPRRVLKLMMYGYCFTCRRTSLLKEVRVR